MVDDIHSLAEQVQSLTGQNRFRTALDKIFAFLDLNPDNEEAQYLASLVIFLTQDPGRTYNAVEPLTEEYLGDTRLDSLFCQCDKCCNSWMQNPTRKMFQAHSAIIFSPPGSKCENCNQIFCRECARSVDDSFQMCPQCDVPLSLFTEPNGRTSRQTVKRKEKLEQVIVFREGPVPPDDLYLSKLLHRLSPEARHKEPTIKAFPLFPWSTYDSVMLNKLVEIFTSNNISIDTHIIDHYYHFKDNLENRLYILKIFHRTGMDIDQGLLEAPPDQSRRPFFTDLLRTMKTKLKAISMERLYSAKMDVQPSSSPSFNERNPFALLEIFRSVEDEYAKESIAKAMLASAHFQRILEHASNEDREVILLQLSRSSDCSNKVVINALAETGSAATFHRLMFFLRYARDNESSWKLAQKAFINLGESVLPTLLELLAEKDPTNRKAQTLGRKRILKILAETGDETCVSAIRDIKASDNTVQAEANQALQAIEKRIGILPEIERSEPEAVHFSLVPPTGDLYVDSCLTLHYTEIDDGREWNEYKELLEVISLVNSGRSEEGLKMATSLKENYPDFDEIYRWIALAYEKQKNYEKAREALHEGLQVSRRKYHLCNYLALNQYKSENLPEAVKWWIQSVLLQEVHQEYGDYEPFLYLAYVCQPFQLEALSNRFGLQADRIRSDKLRLVQSEVVKLFTMVLKQRTPSLALALQIIDQSDLKFGR